MRVFLFIVTFLMLHNSYAQKKEEQFFVFDQNWKPVAIEQATYLLRILQTDPKNSLWTFYHLFGPRLREESFQDDAGTIRNGKCLYYHSNGSLDSAGEFSNGVLDKSWFFYNPEGRCIRKKDYENGILIKDTSFAEPIKDSFMRERLPIPGEIESSFKGGLRGWMQFLNKNFEYPQRALNRKIAGTVHLEFIVDATGKVQDPVVKKSVEYSLDEEAIRIIRKSPNWIPASKDGKQLKSYKLQPITFKLTR
jgi:protein TonB